MYSARFRWSKKVITQDHVNLFPCHHYSFSAKLRLYWYRAEYYGAQPLCIIPVPSPPLPPHIAMLALHVSSKDNQASPLAMSLSLRGPH